MNWTGGTRARATKSSSATTRLQKRYFAKTRAAMQSFALPSSQTGLPISSKRKRHVTPEFDIVVKKKVKPDEDTFKQCASPPFKSTQEDRGKGGGGDRDEKRGKTRRQMLLESDDWVCTALSQPLVMRRGLARFSVLGRDNCSGQGLNDGETHPPVEDLVGDSDGGVEDDGDEGGYGAIGKGGVLDGGEYSGGTEDGHEGEYIPIGDGSGYTKLDGGGYVQIGGPSRRAPTPQPCSWGPPGILQHKDSGGGSEDTMLLDLDIKERPMFHYNHITPTIPKFTERWRQVHQTTEGSGRYSSSPLAAYSRQKGHRISSSSGYSEDLGKSSARGTERSSSLTGSSPMITHAQLASDPFCRDESRAGPRPISGHNSWKRLDKGDLAIGQYPSGDESDAGSIPDWVVNSQGILTSPCPGPRFLSQTKGLEAPDEDIGGEDDQQWERFVKDSPVRSVAGGVKSQYPDVAGGIQRTQNNLNQGSESKKTELKSLNDWYDFTESLEGNLALGPNEEQIAQIPPNARGGRENPSNTSRMLAHVADGRVSWTEFVAAPLDSDGLESPGSPLKRTPDIKPPLESGITPRQEGTARDTEKPKQRVEKKLKVLDEINLSTQEDRLWEAFVYGGLSDGSDMELTPGAEAMYTGQREVVASSNGARPRGRESPSTVMGGRLAGKGKRHLGKLGGLRPDPEVALSQMASPATLASMRVGGSAPKRKSKCLN